jgi:hypothetical protein
VGWRSVAAAFGRRAQRGQAPRATFSQQHEFAPPTDKMSGVRAAHDVHFMDANLFFFSDALEHALRPRSLHANLDSGILGFERLAQPFREWNFHRRVERERTLLVGGLDHGRTQRGRLRRGRRERLGKDGAGRQHRRCPEHVASGKLAISHVRSRPCELDATARFDRVHHAGNSAKTPRATVNAEKHTTAVTTLQGCCHPIGEGRSNQLFIAAQTVRVMGGRPGSSPSRIPLPLLARADEVIE